MFSHIRNGLVMLVLALSVGACGGGGGSGSGGNTGGGSGTNSGTSQSSLTCDSDVNNPYAGCFVSNSCVASAGTTYYSSLTLQFMNDGSLQQTVRVFNAPDCTGSVISSYSLPVIQTYHILQDQLSSTGQTGQVMQVDTSITGVSQAAAGYTLAYLNNKQLCFSQNDYIWNATGGGFQPMATTLGLINLSLNVTDCLSRI